MLVRANEYRVKKINKKRKVVENYKQDYRRVTLELFAYHPM